MEPSALIKDLSSLNDKASRQDKEDLVKKVASLLEVPLEDAENLKIAQAIVRTLSNDAEKSVRATLSNYMRSNSQLPKDVAVKLASDIDTVALPILESSTLISEEELIEIVRTSESAAKQVAIAKREDVTENISAALVDHARDDSVLTTLLENETAQIPIASLSTIVERKTKSDKVMNAFIQRDLVPIELMQKITTSVSDRIREALVEKMQAKFGISEHQLASIADHSAAISILKILDNRPTLFDARALVTNLMETRRMRPDIFMTALLMGKRHFVKYALAMLSDQPLSGVEKLLEAPMMPAKFEALLETTGLLPTFAKDIFWVLKFIDTDAAIGKNTHEVLHALFDHIGANTDHFPNARYFRMMLQSQPAFAKEGA